MNLDVVTMQAHLSQEVLLKQFQKVLVDGRGVSGLLTGLVTHAHAPTVVECAEDTLNVHCC